MIAFDEIPETMPTAPPYFTPRFLSYMPGAVALAELAEAPIGDWHAPALTSTGSEVLAWGGEDGSQAPLRAASRYAPASNAWLGLSLTDAPTSPGGDVVWTDTEAVAWGDDLASGGRYYPKVDRWSSVSPPPDGFGEAAVAGNGRLILWTGTSPATALVTTYDPKDDSWREAPSRCGPGSRTKPLLVWADDGIIVWGGVPDCSTASDASACEGTETQRAFYLPASALFDDVEDATDCTCASARTR